MGSIIEDLYDHEGYGARLLSDGTLTATWSAETASFEAYVAACSCGWRGGEHPPTDEGYDGAVDAWEHDHARPLLADTVPASVTNAVTDAKQAITGLVSERPKAALRALDDLSGWTRHMRQRLTTDDSSVAADRMRHRLDALDERREGKTLGR